MVEQKHVRSLEGSPRPSNLFQPFMPGVELYSDMDAFFAKTRGELAAGGIVPDEEPGQRYFAIVTPDRLVLFEPCPSPDRFPQELVTSMQQLAPANPRLNISVISYTFFEALTEDKAKCIPFMGFLFVLGSIGHSVVVFEGHPSAFETGVRGSHILLVDSGMRPFLQDDWLEVARRVMKPNPRVYVHDRETYTLKQQIPVNDEQSGTQPGQRSWDTCISCGSNEDPYFDTITAYHHPPDAYFGLLVGVLISVAAGTLSNFLPGTPNQHYFLYVLFSISLAAGFEYYSFRSTSAKYHLVACPSCQKKYTNRKLLRVAIITTLVLISVVGAVVVSAVAGSDEYVYLPVISAGIIGVIALYFKLLSKPTLVEAGADESIINVPGLGHVQVENSLSEDRS